MSDTSSCGTRVTDWVEYRVCENFGTVRYAERHIKDWVKKSSWAVGYVEGIRLGWDGKKWYDPRGFLL